MVPVPVAMGPLMARFPVPVSEMLNEPLMALPEVGAKVSVPAVLLKVIPPPRVIGEVSVLLPPALSKVAAPVVVMGSARLPVLNSSSRAFATTVVPAVLLPSAVALAARSVPLAPPAVVVPV